MVYKVFFLYLIIFGYLFFVVGSGNSAENPPDLPGNPVFFDLRSEIDLDKPYHNHFGLFDFFMLKRFYKKIKPGDYGFLIQNINHPDAVKKYFLAQYPTAMDTVKGKPGQPQEIYPYIPSALSGLYFCYQKVYTDEIKYSEFFQVYNFTNNSIIGIDTEDTLLIYPVIENNNNKPKRISLNIYQENGKIIYSGLSDENGFISLPNDGYPRVFASYSSTGDSLFRITLHAIQKTDYNIFAVYNDQDAKFIKIEGLISTRDGKPIINPAILKLRYQLVNIRQEILNQDIIKPDKSGRFFLMLKKENYTQNGMQFIFFNDNTIVKKYVIYNKLAGLTSPITSSAPLANLMILPKENLIFNQAAARFLINRIYLDQIDSIFCYWQKKNQKSEEIIFNPVNNTELNLNLPMVSGEYLIYFEILFNNGSSVHIQYTINKCILQEKDNFSTPEVCFVTINPLFPGEHKVTLDLNNPFLENQAVMCLYNNDFQHYQTITLSKGYNFIPLEADLLTFPNLKILIWLMDLKNYDQICYIRDIMQPQQIVKSISGIIKENNRKLEIKLKQRVDMPAADFFVRMAPLQPEDWNLSDPVYISLSRYNDILAPQLPISQMYPGYHLVTADIPPLTPAFTGAFRIDITSIRSADVIDNFNKLIQTKPPINAVYQGPDYFYETDQPDFKIILRNQSVNNLNLDVNITTGNGMIQQKIESIVLEKGNSADIPFMITDFDNDLPIDLTFKIYQEKELLFGFTKTVIVRRNLIDQSVEISGDILANRQTASYITIPKTDSQDFDVEFYFTANPFVKLLKKNIILNNLNYNLFEIHLAKSIDQYIGRKYFGRNTPADFLSAFYLRNYGCKKYSNDNGINLDSTLLYLYAAHIIPDLKDSLSFTDILKYLLTNYRKKILSSAFRIFILGELGYFFDEIDSKFLTALKNKGEAFYYYRYFSREGLNFEPVSEVDTAVYYDDHKLSNNFLQLLKVYFNITPPDLDQIDYYSYLIESIFAKLIAVDRLETKLTTGPKINIGFKSKVLGSFEAQMNQNEIIYRKYMFRFVDPNDENKRLIDYSISKHSPNTIYYLIRANYQDVPQYFTQNDQFIMTSVWTDRENHPMEKNALQLKKDNLYYINLTVDSNLVKKGLCFKTIDSGSLEINYDTILINGKQCSMGDDNERFIKIPALNPGKNQITYSVIPRYCGQYLVTGNQLFSLYTLNNYLIEEPVAISVE